MNNKVDLTEILLKWNKLPDSNKAEMQITLEKHLATRKKLQDEEKTLNEKMMAYDKAFIGWLNSWVTDDKISQ